MAFFEVLNRQDALSRRTDDYLQHVFREYKAKVGAHGVEPARMARFRKKEPLDKLSKAIIKHRIQTLTGKNINDLEHQLGYNIKTSGTTISLPEIRYLAHLLILEANSPTSAAAAAMKRKRSSDSDDYEDQVEVVKKTKIGVDNNGVAVAKKAVKRASMSAPVPVPSLAPSRSSSRRRTLMSAPPAVEEKPEKPVKSGGRRKTLNNLAPVIREEEEESDDPSENPTPVMLEMMKGKKAKAKVIKNEAKRAAKDEVKKVVTVKNKKGFTGGPLINPQGRTVDSQMYVVHTSEINYDVFANNLDSEFPGFNLSVIHTPADWDATKIFNCVMAVRAMNKQAALESYLVMVGCGVDDNLNMFRTALLRQTNHVDFLTFSLRGSNELEDNKVRKTSSHFLLAYFFPGCQNPDVEKPATKMVRPGTADVFTVDSVVQLEEQIVNAFSENGDWILDFCCKKRELSLAAVRSSRFAVAVDHEREFLETLALKARKQAKQFDMSFKKQDGEIISVHN